MNMTRILQGRLGGTDEGPWTPDVGQEEEWSLQGGLGGSQIPSQGCRAEGEQEAGYLVWLLGGGSQRRDAKGLVGGGGVDPQASVALLACWWLEEARALGLKKTGIMRFYGHAFDFRQPCWEWGLPLLSET